MIFLKGIFIGNIPAQVSLLHIVPLQIKVIKLTVYVLPCLMWGLLRPILEPRGSFFREEFAIERGLVGAQKYDI